MPSTKQTATSLVALILALALGATSCGEVFSAAQPSPGGNDTAGGTGSTTTRPAEDDGGTTSTAAPVQDPAVGQILAGYTSWVDPGLHSTDDRPLQPDQWYATDDDQAGRELVRCDPSPLPMVVRELDELPALGFSGDDVLPGLIVDGSAITTGDVRALPLARAPFTLRSSLASANPTTLVERPNSATIAEAVATLKRDADPRLGAIDVTASDIAYHSSETHSFEQSALEIGVSLRYRNRLVGAGLDADYRQERSTERHAITVKLVQRQLTLSAVDDGVTDPGQYFADTVTPAEVEGLIDAGAIGSANPPMVIDRVTYGRLMYFTMSSTEVRSAQELSAAVEAVKGSYEGTATIEGRHREVISGSEISMVAYGGDQALALGAIRSGDLGQFFGPTNPTTAAPLTFSFRTLDGSPVSLTESTDVNRLSCTRTPAPYRFALRIDKVQGKLRVFINGTEVEVVEDDNPLFGKKVDGTGTLEGARLNDLLSNGENEVRLRYTNLGCDNRFRVRVFDGPSLPDPLSGPLATFSHPSPGCPSEGDMTMTFVLNTTDGKTALR